MNSLQKMFPSLALFSDLDWDAVTQEYEASYIDHTFPEYLQQKALDDDCPPYLFEIAYYEQALWDVQKSEAPFPYKQGLYLNPTALFLRLEFDVVQMLKDAQTGKIEVQEKEHILCVFRDPKDLVHAIELDETSLQILSHLEEGAQPDYDFITPAQQRRFDYLVSLGLVLDMIRDN